MEERAESFPQREMRSECNVFALCAQVAFDLFYSTGFNGCEKKLIDNAAGIHFIF